MRAETRAPIPGSGQLHYLEIVTPDPDAVCAIYAAAYGLSFGESIPELGGARTATLADGSTLGVRGPMHDMEKPVVRPYFLVADIEAAVAVAAAAGAEIAVPPMPIPGRGQCAIFVSHGIESGLWQTP